MIKNRLRGHFQDVFLLLILLSVSSCFAEPNKKAQQCGDCEGAIYEMGSKKFLCVNNNNSDVIKATKIPGGNTYDFILIDLKNMGIKTKKSHVSDVANETTMSITIKGNAEKLEHKDTYAEIFDYAKKNENMLVFLPQYELYKLKSPVSISAGDNFYLLKKTPSSLGTLDKSVELIDWYLGYCPDGFGGERRCMINYTLNGVSLKYSLEESFLSSWREIFSAVNHRVEEMLCSSTDK
jgi:hypothetical protein